MPYTTTLTNAGKELIRTAILEEGKIIFTGLAVGSGTPAPADPETATSLVQQKAMADITSMERGSGYFCRIVSTLYNNQVDTAFEVTELGLYAKGSENGTPILYTYVTITDNDGGIVPPGDNILIERQYIINVFIGDAADVSADITSTEAATKAELKAHNESADAHENRFVLKQDRTDILPATTTLADGDVAPIYTTSSLHRKVTLANLFSYIKSKLTLTASDMPRIPVTKGGTDRTSLTQYATVIGAGTSAVGLVAATKGAYHVTQDNTPPRFTTLPVDCGGTGKESHTLNSTLVGNGANGIKNIGPAPGAYFSPSATAEPRFGTLPVSAGGLGQSNLTAHSVIIGEGTSPVGQVSGTGALYSNGNTADPVFGVLPVAHGGTGNNQGYVRAGLREGVSAGSRATAEGQNTVATGDNSHAEGLGASATGDFSHAEGFDTVANARGQHVFGEKNVEDTPNKSGRSTYVEIVGNGTGDNRSNARTLTWGGDESIAGNFTPMVDNTKDLGSGAKRWKNLFAAIINGALAKKLTFKSDGTGAAAGTNYDNSAAVSVSYNTIGAAAANHSHSPSSINQNGAFGGFVSQKANAAWSSAYVRNIKASTTDIAVGSQLDTGTIYLVYEN